MTLEKAIQLLQMDLNDPGSCNYGDRAKAQEMSIEALKRLRTLRAEPYLQAQALLPSETEF